MTQLSIGVAVRNLIEAKGDWYDGEVEDALSKLQSVLGVTTGDVAGLFFSGHEEKWHTYNETNKFSVIQDYINAETGALYVNSKSQSETENRIAKLKQVIEAEEKALKELINDKDDSYWESEEYAKHTFDICELLTEAWGYGVYESLEWTRYCNKATAPEICEFNIEQCEQKIEQMKIYLPAE